ncbi:NADH-quinone oxidoreductase subunit N [Candidatus Nitrosocaldus cavascurensis]|jgi:NADH-quinone oxidoreductase subunit N|uniref:NADH-quinone oxidoreductase subunit N n=1 Tax=Candidatus Nitrosocaldus cavascurensis TaxID=2058097 RepID=A0A2K5APA2_9ARCH|nr:MULTISPECIES: NADH-quinone oxidoreductase subunit N [Candidatus Nitrosocaldus]SPC33473.1 NADH-quinone oxidoreductase subunit N [Candidatus Nitrosocaldus cavascurensis]
MVVDLYSTPVIITIILGVTGLVLPLLDTFRRRDMSHKVHGSIAFGALILSIAVILARIASGSIPLGITFTDQVMADDMFGSFFSIAMLIVAVSTVVSSVEYMRRVPNPGPYYSLILLSSIGMVILAYSTDLLMLIVAWELMSIPTYVLAAYRKRDPLTNEAAIKYFLFGALASGILIYAASLIYGITGSTNIAVVIQSLINIDKGLGPLALIALALLIAGFGFKMALVPFHMWIPDTYEGAPTPISALLSAATKKAGFAAAFKAVIFGMLVFNVEWSLMLAVIAVLTMTIGNLAALTQRSMTRILAYSSISQAGYMLIGLSLAPYSDLAMQGTLLHVMNHAVMKSSAFIAAAGIALVIGTMNIDQYRGIGRRMPITSLVMAVSLLALAGVPPLNGFWSKFILFAAAVNAGSTVSWAPYLAIAGILNSALSLGYYAWVIRRMYFDEPTSIPALNQSYVYGSVGMLKVREPRLILAVLAFALAFMVGFGVYPAPLISFAQASVPASDVFSTLPRELQSSMQEHSNSNAESMDGSKSNSNGSTTTYNQSVQAGEVGANGVNSNGNGNGDGKTDGSNNYDGGVNSTANGEVRVVEEDKAVTTVVEGSSHSSPSRSRTP